MKIIVANWKMNGDMRFARTIIERLNKSNSQNTVVVCPPAALLPLFENFKYDIGAQNCFCEKNGAFTGENSPALLKDLGCKYVLIGHSERRSIFDESDDFIYKKWISATECNLIPILCIGEKLDERANWKDVISTQLDSYLGKDLSKTIFAYEPVWSIGTGLVADISKIEETSQFIKNILGNDCRLLYGGSVTAKNTRQILEVENIDGVLVGGASLKIDEFIVIVETPIQG